MNLIDFENGFETKISFEGDNEVDVHGIVIIRDAYDSNGNEINIVENIYLKREPLELVAEGLERMAKNIRDYLSDNG